MTSCRIEGCTKETTSRKDICLMHYHRMYRGGTYEKRRQKSLGHITSNGYVSRNESGHPLGDAKGRVYVHRVVAFEKYGSELTGCEMCGKPIDWGNCHVDHIDEVRINNRPENLRVTCSTCNTRRGRKPAYMASNATRIEYEGKIDTAAGWARDSRVTVAGATIINRLKAGLPIEVSLFKPQERGPKKGHKTKFEELGR